MSAISLLDPEEFAEELDGSRREAVITIKISASRPGQIGVVLDEIERVVKDSGLEHELGFPEYHATFYGWEADQDDAPS